MLRGEKSVKFDVGICFLGGWVGKWGNRYWDFVQSKVQIVVLQGFFGRYF